MHDPLKARLAKLQKFSDSAKRRANLYSDIVNMDDSNTARSLSALQKAPAPGKKLQKIGFLMLWIPEPTGVTVAVEKAHEGIEVQSALGRQFKMNIGDGPAGRDSLQHRVDGGAASVS
jgi:hypothetical protein